MNFYSILFIIDKELLDDKVEEFIRSVESKITAVSGVIVHKENQGRKKLAYSVHGKNEGTYVYIQFDMPINQCKVFETFIKEQHEIVRYLLVKEQKGVQTSLDIPDTYSYI